MTFIPKDFNFVTEEFKSNIKKYLKDIKVDSIDKITDKNRIYQIQFIQAVIDELVKSPKRIEKSETLYGALLLINEDITNRSSDLRDYVQITINKDQKSEPSNQQKAEYFSKINRFLRSIYIENQSVNGINLDNPFKIVPISNLTDLYLLSFDKERKYHNAFINSLKATSKNGPQLASAKTIFAPKQEEAHVEWTKLLKAFEEGITEELRKHGVTHESKLSNTNRYQQITFLRRLKDLLSNDGQTKEFSYNLRIAIFVGALYAVRGQIAAIEYSKPALYDKDLSTLHTEITNMLNSKTAKPEEIQCYADVASEFFSKIFLDENEKIRIVNPFDKNKDFSCKSLLTILNDIRCESQSSALKICSDKIKGNHKDNQKQTTKEGGFSAYLSMFSGKSDTTAKPQSKTEEAPKPLETTATLK